MGTTEFLFFGVFEHWCELRGGIQQSYIHNGVFVHAGGRRTSAFVNVSSDGRANFSIFLSAKHQMATCVNCSSRAKVFQEKGPSRS